MFCTWPPISVGQDSPQEMNDSFGPIYSIPTGRLDSASRCEQLCAHLNVSLDHFYDQLVKRVSIPEMTPFWISNPKLPTSREMPENFPASQSGIFPLCSC